MTPLERIEKATKEYTKDWPLNKLPANKIAFRNGAIWRNNAVLQEAIERIESLLRDARDTNGESQKISNAVGILNSLKIPE